jgi:hypothetical protein
MTERRINEGEKAASICVKYTHHSSIPHPDVEADKGIRSENDPSFEEHGVSSPVYLGPKHHVVACSFFILKSCLRSLALGGGDGVRVYASPQSSVVELMTRNASELGPAG